MEFQYLGLKAELERRLVTEEDVNKNLERLRQQTPSIHTVTDRAAQNGDELVLDYAGYCNGVQFQGGTAEMQTLTLGSGMFIPGFEEQLVGAWPGDEKIVKVTFPEVYHSEELAGKDAEFHCAIHEIRTKALYELDDRFAKEIGGCDTMEEFRIRMAESLQAYQDACAEEELRDTLLRKAADTLEYAPDAAQLEAGVEDQLSLLRARLAQQNLSLELYCQFTAQTEAQIREDLRPVALQTLRMKAAVDKIVELEKLQLTEAEIAATADAVCAQSRMTLEELRQSYQGDFDAAVEQTALAQAALNLIRKSAEVTVITK